MSISRNLQISGGYYENVRAVISAINAILGPTAVIGYDKLKNKTQLVAVMTGQRRVDPFAVIFIRQRQNQTGNGQ